MVRPFWQLLRRYPQVPQVALDEVAGYDSGRRMPIALAQEMLRGAVALTQEDNLGLLAARETEMGSFEVLEYVASSAPTWREALETIFRYSHLMNEAADFRLEEHNGKAHVILASTIPLERVGVDFQTAAFLIAVQRWLQPPPSEAEVWFTYPRPPDTSEHERTFGDARIVFDAPWNGFVFDAARLETRLATNDPSLHRVLREHADRLLVELAPGDSMVQRVRAHILESLAKGPVSAAETAALMHVTRRTLTRRLRQEGTSFTELLEDVRRGSATHYLQTTDYSVEDIAFLLGFSGASPFVRAFKRWTGQSPQAYRRAHRS